MRNIVQPLYFKFNGEKRNETNIFKFKDLSPGKCFILEGSEVYSQPSVYMVLSNPITMFNGKLNAIDLRTYELKEFENKESVIPLNVELLASIVDSPVHPSEMK